MEVPMTRLSTTVLLPVALALLSGACATAVPASLVYARLSYASSAKGITGYMAPSPLAEARGVLDKANEEFATHGDTATCRDYAYIAANKLELADSVARANLTTPLESEAPTVSESTSPPANELRLASAR
jgi:hypothetical protein